jgi:hypothetical protein
MVGKPMISIHLRKNLCSTLTLSLLLACGQPFIGSVAADESAFDAVAEYAVLDKAASTDGQAWFALAGNARAAGDLDTASRALERAAGNGMSPVRIGVEKSRILVSGGNSVAAIQELDALLASGFTSVGIITGDQVLASMAGQAAFDDLVHRMSVQAYPCQYDEKFSEFDYWVGEWNVHVASGQLVGHNLVEVDQKGCVILENWTNSGGGRGMSINYVDKITDEWVQVWNAEGGSQINVRGGLTDEGMSLVGTLHTVSNGTTVPFRALFTLLSDGRVRQFFEQSNDDGATWVPWFEGFYTRVDSS